MGAVAVDDGFEQSSRGDYSGRTLGRSSKTSEKKLSFQYLSVRLIPPFEVHRCPSASVDFFIFLSQPFGYRYLQSDSSIIRSSEDNQHANDSHSRMVFPIGKFS